jgi:hypothetical protein
VESPVGVQPPVRVSLPPPLAGQDQFVERLVVWPCQTRSDPFLNPSSFKLRQSRQGVNCDSSKSVLRRGLPALRGLFVLSS